MLESVQTFKNREVAVFTDKSPDALDYVFMHLLEHLPEAKMLQYRTEMRPGVLFCHLDEVVSAL